MMGRMTEHREQGTAEGAKVHWFAETKARYNMGANRTRLNRVLVVRGRRERDPSTHVRVCLLTCAEHGVTLLPQELAGAKEGRGVLELPADNVGPLVQAQRQVTGHNNQQQHQQQQYQFQTRQRRETSVTTQLPPPYPSLIHPSPTARQRQLVLYTAANA